MAGRTVCPWRGGISSGHSECHCPSACTGTVTGQRIPWWVGQRGQEKKEPHSLMLLWPTPTPKGQTH